MKKYIVLSICAIVVLVLIQGGNKVSAKNIASAAAATATATVTEAVSHAFGNETKVTITGYDGDSMEPFISKDGQYLFWNSLNDGQHTSLYYAKKIATTTFQFLGEVKGVNGTVPHLDGVASMDKNNNFYWVSLRDYPKVFENLQHGTFKNGVVSGVAPVQGDIYKKEVGWIIMDAEISGDGKSLYYVDAQFNGGQVPVQADISLAHKVGTGFVKDIRSSDLLKNINTPKLEYAPSTSENGLEILFTRLSGTTTSIHRSTRNSINDIFGVSELLPIVGNLPEGTAISSDGTTIYYHKKDGNYYRIYSMKRNMLRPGMPTNTPIRSTAY